MNPSTISRKGGTDHRFLLHCIAALLCMATIAIPVAATIDLSISGIVNVNPAQAVFGMEPNTLSVTNIKNTGTEAANNVVVRFNVTDVNGGTTPIAEYTIPTIAAGGTYSITAAMGVTDPTLRDTQYYQVRYGAVLDPDNLIAETNEANNAKLSAFKNVRFNGYKGVQYWPGKPAPETYLTYDIHGNVIHSFGDSNYVSGKGDRWHTLEWHWTAADLPVPEGATVKAVRLYVPYCWDYENEVAGGSINTTFNGVLLTPVHLETDESNAFAYDDFMYGLITYDVTDEYIKNGLNTATFSRYWYETSPSNEYQAGSLSPAGFTVAVVYEDQSETRKQIFINEGWDLLGASAASYGTSEEEATSYQEFTGMTIDMAHALKANLTTFVPWGAGDPGEGNLFVNGAEIGQNVWSYGAETTGSGNGPQVAVDVRDILGNLNAGGTGNTIGIQSTAGASPCMVAERSFLVVEYPDETPVPEFPIMAFPVLVIGALAVTTALVYRRK